MIYVVRPSSWFGTVSCGDCWVDVSFAVSAKETRREPLDIVPGKDIRGGMPLSIASLRIGKGFLRVSASAAPFRYMLVDTVWICLWLFAWWVVAFPLPVHQSFAGCLSCILGAACYLRAVCSCQPVDYVVPFLVACARSVCVLL